MSRLLFLLIVVSTVAYSVAQYVPAVPLEADAEVAVNPVLMAEEPTGSDARPKRQFGLGFLLGSALGGGYGYGRPYGGYGGYGGYGHGYGHGHGHHHHYGGHYRRPYPYGGYGYGR